MELAAYLRHIPLDKEADPLVWWKENQGHYPRLSMLARKYLCITATSSPSERVFSTGGDIAIIIYDVFKLIHYSKK